MVASIVQGAYDKFPDFFHMDTFIYLFSLLSLKGIQTIVFIFLLLFPHFGLLQVFIELENLHRTSNYVLYCSDSISHNRVQV